MPRISETATSGGPTQCVACGTHEGPFWDTETDVVAYGHVYVCVGTKDRPGCIAQAAREAGYADPALAQSLNDELQKLRFENIELRAHDHAEERVAELLNEIQDFRAGQLAAAAPPGQGIDE
jgi:hypothetical protein